MTTRVASYWREVASGKRKDSWSQLLVALLVPASLSYSLIMHLRASLYRIGVWNIKRLPLPVISVGNISVGGVGKTPTVLFIASLLMARGKRVVVLTRGYGGSLEGETRIVSDGESLLLSPQEAGDEPCLLASSLQGLMVVMGSDRYSAGCLAIKELAPECFILDDGFQHQRLARDLDILLLDTSSPFANGWTLPAGFLREPSSAIGRADLIILTRSSGLQSLPELLPQHIPVCSSFHSLKGYVPLAGGEIRQLTELVGRRVVAFCGIADPGAFFDGIEDAGVPLAATLSFPDHTPYGVREMEAIGRLRQQSRADCLVTTGKDAVKLQPYIGIIGDCFVVQMELTLHDPQPLMAALDKII